MDCHLTVRPPRPPLVVAPTKGKGAQGEKGTGVIEETLKETINDQSKEIQVLLDEVGSLTTEVLDLEKDVGTVENLSVGQHRQHGRHPIVEGGEVPAAPATIPKPTC